VHVEAQELKIGEVVTLLIDGAGANSLSAQYAGLSG
jgi:hypothetical protein